MAVPDAVPASPPPAARIVVVMLALVRFARVLRVAAGALTYLCLAVACISSGAAAALLVARRAWGKGSGPFLFLQALMYGGVKVCLYSVLASFALAVLLLCVQRVAYLMAVASGSTSVFEKSAFGSIKREPVAGLFRLPRAAVLGLVVDAAFFLLTVAGLLLALLPSQRSFFIPGGRTRRNGKHDHSAVEMKLRREGVRRIWQGATSQLHLHEP
ncbi:hypothetical protein ZWY2020_009750 [Hordeum vulgare]|nr:hypothetical protein ZWY2020_009750 [Hordeum vulgare]